MDHLFATCRPRLVIAHGVDAHAYMRERHLDVAAIECRHFSRISRVAVMDVVSDARRRLDG